MPGCSKRTLHCKYHITFRHQCTQCYSRLWVRKFVQWLFYPIARSSYGADCEVWWFATLIRYCHYRSLFYYFEGRAFYSQPPFYKIINGKSAERAISKHIQTVFFINLQKTSHTFTITQKLEKLSLLTIHLYRMVPWNYARLNPVFEHKKVCTKGRGINPRLLSRNG